MTIICPKCNGRWQSCVTCGSSGKLESISVSAMADYICLSDEDGEIVYWDRQEWLDDPDLCVTIAATINYGMTHGAVAVRSMLSSKNIHSKKDV